MRHNPSAFDLDIQTARTREFEAATTAAEVKALDEKWRREDEAAEQAAKHAADWRDAELHELRARVARLEHFIEAKDDGLVELLAMVTGKLRKDIRSEIEQRSLMTYKGVWDEAAEYQPGSFVTAAGAGWVAVGPIEKGERPGKAPGWKLAIKSPPPKEPAIA
jgi:uncharacterized protein YhaN